MGGAGPAVGRLPAQSGRQTGIQRGASAHPRGLGAERCGRRYDRHGFQPVLCRAGPDRRIYRRPFQPQVDRDGERPLLEHRHHVHGTLQRIPDAGRDAQHRNGRRRSLLRACELLAHRRLPRPDASLRHVDPRLIMSGSSSAGMPPASSANSGAGATPSTSSAPSGFSTA